MRRGEKCVCCIVKIIQLYYLGSRRRTVAGEEERERPRDDCGYYGLVVVAMFDSFARSGHEFNFDPV